MLAGTVEGTAYSPLVVTITVYSADYSSSLPFKSSISALASTIIYLLSATVSEMPSMTDFIASSLFPALMAVTTLSILSFPFLAVSKAQSAVYSTISLF